MLLSPKSPVNQNNGGTSAAAAGSSSSTIFSTPQPPSRPQHIFTPASASSAPPQSTFLNTHNHSNNSHARAKRQQFPSTNTIPSQQLSFQSSHTLTTSGHGTAASGSTNNYEHSFMIEQPLSTSEHTATKQSPSPYSTVRRDRLGTFESVMAVRSLGSGGKMASRRKNNHSDMVQQILSASVTANERVDGRDTSTSNDDDDDDDNASDVSSLSDDGTTQGAAAAATTTNVASGGRTMASLLKKPRAIRKKKTTIRPNSISGRQSSDHAASSIATTSITSATHTMETIECSFPSPLTAEINVEKVKSSKDLMGNNSIHRRSQSSISGVSFQLGGGGSINRSPMIHDAWLSPASGYGGDSSSIQPKEGEDLIDITTDAPIDPFSGLIGMPSSSLSMCDNSFASGTTASLAEKRKPTSSFLRKPAMVSRSKTDEFDPFSKVKSEIPRAPRYLRDNPLLSKSRYRVRSSPQRQHKRAPSLDTACMIGSIAMSETNAAASVTTSTSADKEEEEEDLVSNLPPIVQKTTEEADEDNDDSDSSYASFSEELNRKNRGKAFVGDVRNLMEKVLPVAKSNETKLQRSSEGCLT